MIQRKQSLFLLLAFLCAIIQTVLELFGTVPSSCFDFSEVCSFPACLNFLAVVLLAVGGILSLVAVFMFRNRLKQIKVVRISQIVILLCVALQVAHFFLASKATVDVVAVSSIVAFLLNQLSLKAIAADERKVRAADRIR